MRLCGVPNQSHVKHSAVYAFHEDYASRPREIENPRQLDFAVILRGRVTDQQGAEAGLEPRFLMPQ